MKKQINLRKLPALGFILVAATALSACSNTIAPISLEPIPGSITYKGQPRTKLTKVPIGSTFRHEIDLGTGDYYIETYQVQEDRSLTIIRRTLKRERHFLNF